MPLRTDDALGVTASDHSIEVELDPATAVRFATDGEHPSASLVFGRGRVRVDVSIQPGAVATAIDEQARATGTDPNVHRLAVFDALHDWTGDLDWCPRRAAALVTAIGAFTHPLLRPLYEPGRVPVTEIPRWASPILRATTPADAARVLGGAQVTRRVGRALAASLAVDPERVELDPLAIAVAVAGLVNADQLANTLEAATARDRSGTPSATPSTVISVDQVRTIRDALTLYPADRRARLALDVARHHDAVRLADVATKLWWVRTRVAHPLPVNLDALDTVCTRLIPVVAPPAPALPSDDTAPHAGDRPVPHRATMSPETEAPAVPLPESLCDMLAPAAPVAAPPRPTPQAPTAALYAPVSGHSHPRRWSVPAALRPVQGHRIGELTLSVPTSTDELQWWGRRLDNCLGSYGHAAARNESWLIGIERGDVMIGCIEVRPRSRTVRQALGPRNRTLAVDVYESATSALTRFGLLRAPGN